MDEPRDESIVNVDRAYQTAWIVYINGIECPALSVSIAYGVWQIPECEITLIPDPVLHRLGAEDRVSVQVFYCDYWQRPDEPEFRLMFDGEIVAWSYVNVQRGRAISFTAIDYIQIFTQIFFFFMSNIDDIAVGVSNQEIGVGINTVNTPGYAALYPYSLFSEGLLSPDENSAPTIKRPIDFVYNIVRSLIQSSAPNRSIPAANFFAPWTERTKFHRRFVALPMLERSDTTDAGLFPILRAVQAEFAVSAVARMAQSIGSSGSIWEMLIQILQTMMMEINMLPTPSAVSINNYPSTDSTGLVPNGPPGERSEGTNPIFLTNYFVKPQFLFGIPPSCNVFYPSQISHFAYQENFITQPTRMYFNEESWTSYLNVGANVDPGLRTLLRDALAVAHPEEVHLAARAAVERAGENGKNLLVYPEEFYKGPVVDRRPMPRWFAFLEQAQQGTAPAPGTPPPTPPTSPDVAPGDEERNVYKLYAKYEYFKERYARRTGSLNLAFNPYPVPGFPCAVFDRRSTQMDIFGYIMNVRQNMHSQGWETQVAFSYGRTFNEMFAMLNQHNTAENATIGLQTANTVAAVVEGEQSRLDGQAEPIGPIATAPPEPISEVRDVIQHFREAELFYRSLFFRASAPDAATVDAGHLRAETDRRANSTDDAITEPTIVEPPPPTARADISTPEDTIVARDLQGKRAAFHYNEIIEFIDDQGQRSGIQLEGINSGARTRILNVLAQMRRGEAVEEDLAFVRQSVNRPNLQQQEEGSTNPNVTQTLDSIEIAVRQTYIRSNINGEQTISPRREALHLFNSYESAMRQAARPICTLEEYINFLGRDGAREELVSPETALLQGDSRSFPAHYYVQIRKYVPGPPVQTPSTDIANTSGGEVQALPADFPENRANWNAALLAYRNNALLVLAPRT